MTCGREITPRLWLLQQGVNPCTACSTYGFDRTGPAIVYLITHDLLGAHKIGIAGFESRRLEHHRSAGWRVYRTLDFLTGEHAFRVEQRVLAWMRGNGWPAHLKTGSGWTETVDATVVTLDDMWTQVADAVEAIGTGS